MKLALPIAPGSAGAAGGRHHRRLLRPAVGRAARRHHALGVLVRWFVSAMTLIVAVDGALQRPSTSG